MGGGFKIMTIRGIAISIHVSWLLAVAIITWSLGAYFHQHFPDWGASVPYVVAAICALLLFVAVLLHELAHSFTARALGLPVNSITLFIFGGVSNLSREPDNARTELLVAVAGPLTSLVLAGVFYALYLLSLASHWPSEVLAALGYLSSINLALALFNLIPGFPLDGGRVFRSLVWMITGKRRTATRIASVVGQGIGIVFILVGVYVAFVSGDIISGIWLAFIGWFLQSAAGASYQQAVMDQALRGVEVQNVMDRAPRGVSRITTLEDIVYGHMLAGNQRSVPVVDPDGRLRGLVTLSDLQKVPREQWADTSVTDAMTPADALVTVQPHEDLAHALQALAANRYHQLPVVEDAHLVGMLDRAHVLQWIHLREQLGQGGRPLAGTPPSS